MRLIKIECQQSGILVVNTDQICDISENIQGVVVTMADGRKIFTKFTDASYAVDYILRAEPHNKIISYTKIVNEEWSD